ncbi:putative endopeptidase [Lachnospiraceae bacterium]|nr:putative endopeptidase [Lachnospiraceae bacterium]
MRIKRTDRNFAVRQKADRKIHYAGQGKKYTENTASFSPKEKQRMPGLTRHPYVQQDALKQKNFPGAGIGIQVQKQSGSNRNTDSGADDTAKSYQQEYGSSVGGRSGNGCRDLDVYGNLHVRKPLQKYRKESALYDKKAAGSGQTEQRQHPAGQNQMQQEIQKPSAYHENTIKTKESVIHRKEDTLSGIKKTDNFSLKERRGRKAKIQEQKSAGSSKIYKKNRTGESQQGKAVENYSVDSTAGVSSASGSVQSFSDKRDEQISRYKRKKFFGAEKQKYSQSKSRKENTGRRADKSRETETNAVKMQKSKECQTEVQSRWVQGAGEISSLQKQNNLSVTDTNASPIKKRNAGDSIRQRDGDIPGRKDEAGRKDKNSKKTKGKKKDSKKDNSHYKGKSRKDRAAAFRLLSYASDKFSQGEQKDSLLKVAKDLVLGKIKAVTANAFLSIGAALLPVLIPVFVMVLIITLLFNSPFSILLPKLSEEPGAVEVLAEYTEDFRERVQEELADPGRGDETELIYEDYEGDGEPDNMADILMVYMVKYGFGDTATVMTQKNRKALKDTFDEMTSLEIAYRTEIVEQSYEEEDFYGNITIKTEEVEIKIKEVRITLLTSEDIISTGIFTEEETEILRYLMLPEVLENIEGLTGGYGSPGAGSLTPEEAERLNLGGDTGSQAVKNALARLGKPYSQAKRDSGDYYDCSSLTYYSYKEAGITLSYHGSNTAASQGQLLSDRGCEVAYEDIQPGDLIFYSFTRNGRYQNISHVAVYAGNGYLVDASSSKGCVVFRPVYSIGKIVMCGRPSWL